MTVCSVALLCSCAFNPKNHEVYFSGWVTQNNHDIYKRGKGVMTLDFDAKHHILNLSLKDSSNSDTLFYLDAASLDVPLGESFIQHYNISGQIFSPPIQDVEGLVYKADFYSSDAEWFFLNTPTNDTSFFYYQGAFDNPKKWKKSMRNIVNRSVKLSP